MYIGRGIYFKSYIVKETRNIVAIILLITRILLDARSNAQLFVNIFNAAFVIQYPVSSLSGLSPAMLLILTIFPLVCSKYGIAACVTLITERT